VLAALGAEPELTKNREHLLDLGALPSRPGRNASGSSTRTAASQPPSLRRFSAYVLGVIGPETRRDLTRIRKIRNVFAHAKRRLDFDIKEIVELCDFAICKSDVWKTAVGAATLAPREIFVEAVQIIAEGLMCPIALP